jgi:hypothetical protein
LGDERLKREAGNEVVLSACFQKYWQKTARLCILIISGQGFFCPGGEDYWGLEKGWDAMGRMQSVVLLVVMSAVALWAFDGIAVSDVNGNGVYVHEIKNSAVVRTALLLEGCCDGDNPTKTIVAHRPAINTYGTHVAFIRHSVGGTHVSLMRLDGTSTVIKDIVTAAGITQLEWPRGEWVYYTIGGKLYKVNVQSAQSELVLTLSMPDKGIEQYPFRDQFTMSADARRMHFQLAEVSDSLEYLEGRYTYELPGDGVLKHGVHGPGGGCGPSVSPSGTMKSFQLNSAHSERLWWTWDGVMPRDSGAFNRLEWNRWSVDKLLGCIYTVGDVTWQEYVGDGIVEQCNRWCRNSEEWMVLPMGWAYKGRYSKNNSNLVLVNFRDSLSLNVTRYPRFVSAQYPIAENCTYAGTVVKRVGHGDFWLQAPLESVYAPLREDVLNRDSYKIACIDDGQPCAQPILPAHQNHSLYPALRGLRALQLAGGAVEVHTAPRAVVQLYSVNGKLLWSGVAADGMVRIPMDRRAVGVSVVRSGTESMLLNRLVP